jgi:ParB family chromosome partitioning protein
MRHDAHFVEEVTSGRHTAIGVLVDIDRLEPNPHQPRKHFGDLSEMVASIKEKGVLEPILVRSVDGKFQIIAGERRYQASIIAGLSHLPCVEIDVDNKGSLEISLIENLQRKDLTPFEEAAALQRLCDQFGYTHDQVARKLGKSRTSITETLSLNRMPEPIQDICRQADIGSRSTLLEIVRQDSLEEMFALIERIGAGGLTRDEVRDHKRAEGKRQSRARNFVYRFRPEGHEYSFTLRFKKSQVERRELISTLRQILERLMTKDPQEKPIPGSRSSSH